MNNLIRNTHDDNQDAGTSPVDRYIYYVVITGLSWRVFAEAINT